MLADRLEGKWIDLFAEVFARCKVGPGNACAILSESQSRALHVQLAASTFVVDCTLEGLMHSAELPAILKGEARSSSRSIGASPRRSTRRSCAIARRAASSATLRSKSRPAP
jgi:hypothetical protein